MPQLFQINYSNIEIIYKKMHYSNYIEIICKKILLRVINVMIVKISNGAQLYLHTEKYVID